jgi:inosose dehydratase
MQIRVGAAPVSWGVWFPDDPKQPPAAQFLDEAVEAGFEWIELGPVGYLPSDIDDLRKELAPRGLRVASQVAMRHLEDGSDWAELEKEVNSTCERLAAFDASYMVLIDDVYRDLHSGVARRPPRLEDSAWSRLIETTEKVAAVARDRFGIGVAFHPHVDTHVETEDQIEALIDETDPDLVHLCLDTGHHAYGGLDPLEFYDRHHDRIPYLHLKSIDADVRDRVARDGISFAEAVAQDMFVEPSTGAIDFAALLEKLKEHEFDGWAVVEQDIYPAPFDKPLPIARRTREYLRAVGYG